MHANSYLAVQISIRSPHRQEQHNSLRGCKCGNVLRLTMKAAHRPALGFRIINLVSLKGFRVLASVNARSWIRWLLFIVMDFMFQSHKVAQGLSARFFFSFIKIEENEMCWSISASATGFSSPALGMEQTLQNCYEKWNFSNQSRARAAVRGLHGINHCLNKLPSLQITSSSSS